MADLNRILLLGRLVHDPELKHVSGTPLCKFRIATSREWKDKSGEKQKDVCYVDVQVWGAQADACQRYLTKGRQVFLEGSLDFQEWERDGQRRSKHEVRANRVQFLGGGQGAGDRQDDQGHDDRRGGGRDQGTYDDLPF